MTNKILWFIKEKEKNANKMSLDKSRYFKLAGKDLENSYDKYVCKCNDK